MLFIDNKYTRWYYDIINRAQTRAFLTSYSETHHIIPRSLGGSDGQSNLVSLTAREHFISHWLLTKMTTGSNRYKMVYACKRMMHSSNKDQQRYQINSRLYETLKLKLNVMLTGQKYTEERKANQRIAARKRADTEDEKAKATRRATMIKVNNARKGEKRPKQTGSNNYFYHNKFIGEDNHFYGKSHTEDTLNKLRVPKPKFVCEHCNAVVGGEGNYKRWHGNNCKMFTLAKEEQNASA